MSEISVTGVLQRRAWEERVLPPVELVRPGLWSIPVPIPANPLRYVLCYCFETEAGPVLVDPGWPMDGGWEALEGGLASVGLDLALTYGVLITHAHLDHHGLAGRVRVASGCWVSMHPAEEDQVARLRDVESIATMNERWLTLCGVPDGEVSNSLIDPYEIKARANLVPDRLLVDGNDAGVPGWDVTALWTPGHTPGHLCFLVGGHDVVLTGDHMLPRITPNISSYYEDDAPLDTYLSSLDRMRAYDDREALPGHEYRFRGIAGRVEVIQHHHAERLEQVSSQVAALDGGTTWEIAEALKWSRSWEETTGFLRRAAVGETLAHLRSLELAGLVRGSARAPMRWRLAEARTLPG